MSGSAGRFSGSEKERAAHWWIMVSGFSVSGVREVGSGVDVSGVGFPGVWVGGAMAVEGWPTVVGEGLGVD
jgi:hypothetical protein